MKWIRSYTIFNESKIIDTDVIVGAVNEFNKYFNIAGVSMEQLTPVLKDGIRNLTDQSDIEYFKFPLKINYQEQLLLHHIIEFTMGYPSMVRPAASVGGSNYRKASHHGLRATIISDNEIELRLYQDYMKNVSDSNNLFNKMARIINGLLADATGYYTSDNSDPRFFDKPINNILNEILEEYSWYLVNNNSKNTDEFYKIALNHISRMSESHNVINTIRGNRNPFLWNKIKTLINPEDLEKSAELGGMGFSD